MSLDISNDDFDGSDGEFPLMHLFECEESGCGTMFAVEADAGSDVTCPACRCIGGGVKFLTLAFIRPEAWVK